jgi:ferredoxin-NADP reductase
LADNKSIELRVTAAQPAARGIILLTLAKADGDNLPSWTPGAHIDVHLPIKGETVIRQYSLCGDVEDKKHWQIAVLRVAEGRGGSCYVHDSLKVGDVVSASNPKNNFELVPAGEYLFIAGGVGITPILPMVRKASRDGVRWKLICCAKTAENFAFLDDLGSLPGGEVVAHPSGVNGRLNLAALLESLPAECHIYSCGPQGMLDELAEVGAKVGVDRVHIERFTPIEVDSSEDETFEVEFAGSGISFMVAPGQSILELAEEHGIDVDSSCQEGTCGTCETRVISGIPDHRDSVLGPRERAANKTMMICVSRATCKKLVLDA